MTTPKYTGRDVEFSTAGIDREGRSVSNSLATSAILKRIDALFEQHDRATWPRRTDQDDDASSTSDVSGYSRSSSGYGGYSSGYGGWSQWSRASSRHWCPGGGCFYNDMGHVEACTAETIDPLRLAAQLVANARVVEAARARAEAEDGVRYEVSTACVDASDPSIAWGPHYNFSVTPELWETLCLDARWPAVHGFVVSALAAAIPFFGTGFLLPMSSGETVFSLSGRAHHLTRICTYPTTDAFKRGLLNARREPHGTEVDRLHLIGFDQNLISSALCTSFMQCVLAAAEAGFGDFVLCEPLRALHEWSWKMNIQTGSFDATAQLAHGGAMTLPKYIGALARKLLKMCETRFIPNGVAPRALELLPMIIELCERASSGDIVGCARHLDWAAKLLVITDLSAQPGVRFGDAATRLADHDFGNVNPEVGAIWRLWREGHIDPLIDEAAIEACLLDGPPETRAWTRGRLVQKYSHAITDLDWSRVEFAHSEDRWKPHSVVELPSIGSAGEAEFGAIIDAANDVDDLVAQLTATGAGSSNTAMVDPLIDISGQLAIPKASRPTTYRSSYGQSNHYYS